VVDVVVDLNVRTHFGAARFLEIKEKRRVFLETKRRDRTVKVRPEVQNDVTLENGGGEGE